MGKLIITFIRLGIPDLRALWHRTAHILAPALSPKTAIRDGSMPKSECLVKGIYARRLPINCVLMLV